MYYFFILEGLGTPELLLIAVVALVVFGPRKIPDLARTFGKTIAEFKKTTNEFKTTWEREVDIESLDEAPPSKAVPQIGSAKSAHEAPSIKPVTTEVFASHFQTENLPQPSSEDSSDKQAAPPVAEKKNWL